MDGRDQKIFLGETFSHDIMPAKNFPSEVIAMFGIGAGEFILILVVGLIVFGPSKLPEVGRSIGKAIREFRKAQSALTNALSETEAQIVAAPKPAAQPVANPAVENKIVEPQRTTVNDVTDMINAKPIAVPDNKIDLSKTDAGKES